MFKHGYLKVMSKYVSIKEICHVSRVVSQVVKMASVSIWTDLRYIQRQTYIV